MCYPYFSQSQDDLIKLSEKVWVVPPGAQLQVLLLAFPFLSLELVVAGTPMTTAFALMLMFLFVSQ